jgi:D-inositol-3-phosphate glycosyltransferase
MLERSVMKIAFISDHASPLAPLGGADSGGQNVYVAQLARELSRAGHSIDIFTRCDDAKLPRICACGPNVRVIHVQAGPPSYVTKEKLLPYMYAFAARTVEYCSGPLRRYDLVHANFFMSGIAAMRLKKKLKLPFVITFHALGKVRRLHQGEADQFPPDRINIESLLVRSADRIIAQCPQDREDLIKLYDASPNAIATVPCGIDPTEINAAGPGVRGRLGLCEDEFVVLQLGRLVPRKGIDNVIRGVAHLARAHEIRARLLIVGGESCRPDPVATPEIARLTRIAEEEGVQEQVTFTGHRPRTVLREYYSAADVFVTTPWYEPFGMTPLEAMGCGTPVIGAAVGGIKHTVVDSVTGFLVPPRDPAALADRLACLHRHPELARGMGRAGIRHVHTSYTWRNVASEMERAYGSVVTPRQLRAEKAVVY